MAYGHDSAEDGVITRDPIEEMEPGEEQTNEYREAALRFIVFMHSSFTFIKAARTLEERDLRTSVVMSALDHPDYAGNTDTELAARAGTSRANWSKHKLAYERQNSLPPTSSQKSVEARSAYRETRISQLNGND